MRTDPEAEREMVSTHAQLMVRVLIDISSLASMGRGSGKREFLERAAAWLPTLESQMDHLRRELSQFGTQRK